MKHMDAALFAAQLNQYIATIDLHDIGSIHEALEQLETRLFSFYNEGASSCRVIYGIGEGTLATTVQQALNKNPMVVEWHHEETGGSCIVLF